MLRTPDVNGHAFIRARPDALNVSWDRVDDQSPIDHPMAMFSPIADADEGSTRPHLEHFIA